MISEPTTLLSAPRSWMTPAEAGRELGCEAPTMRKRMAEYGGYRVGRRIRFDRATILNSKSQPDFAHKPNATIQHLAAELEAQAVLNKQFRIQMTQELARLNARIADLEKQISPHAIAA